MRGCVAGFLGGGDGGGVGCGLMGWEDGGCGDWVGVGG